MEPEHPVVLVVAVVAHILIMARKVLEALAHLDKATQEPLVTQAHLQSEAAAALVLAVLEP
jgi:hypothetical protein